VGSSSAGLAPAAVTAVDGCMGKIDRRMGLVGELEVETEESYFLAAATFLTKESTSPKIRVDLIRFVTCPISETSFQACCQNVGIFSVEKVRPRTTDLFWENPPGPTKALREP